MGPGDLQYVRPSLYVRVDRKNLRGFVQGHSGPLDDLRDTEELRAKGSQSGATELSPWRRAAQPRPH
jgi:hypothetical protein